jgi:hypothetical protein
MNGFVPVLLAVALAEFGPRAAIYANARRFETALWLIAACVIASAAAGQVVAPTLTGWADAFLIAISLAFAALGQMHRVKPATGVFRTVAAFWRGGVVLIAFAFAARYGAAAAALGTLAGMTAAAVLTRVVEGARQPVAPFRWVCAGVLITASFVVAVQALRLV